MIIVGLQVSFEMW